MIAIGAITIYTSYGDYEKIASGYIAAYSHRHFADVMKDGKEQRQIIMDRIFEDYVSSATVQLTSHDAF